MTMKCIDEKIIKNPKERKRYVRYKEGAEMYGVCLSTFTKIVKEAKAIIKYGKLVLINCDYVDQYLESYRVEE